MKLCKLQKKSSDRMTYNSSLVQSYLCGKGRKPRSQAARKPRSRQSKMTRGFGCVQCGTRSNPCRCKVVGPTLGLLAFAAAAIVEWPVGAVVYLFRHTKGRRIMGHPSTVVYPRVSNSIPI
ncbi:uncharacterized protein LOC133715845 [Rosa rugosa]|uniref:uncharacterized protein LOC133715845 n=1 Tax=Rosa rugosa TaxID=74645 RepID=UPI002B404998|nr:uncharacterized protein LOC133715845 [Rosa rugosa]